MSKFPRIGQRYHSVQNSKSVVMEVTEITSPGGDDWVEFKNIETKQSYNCRLEAFLARYSQLPD
jgi:hypothetical protein